MGLDWILKWILESNVYTIKGYFYVYIKHIDLFLDTTFLFFVLFYCLYIILRGIGTIFFKQNDVCIVL